MFVSQSKNTIKNCTVPSLRCCNPFDEDSDHDDRFPTQRDVVPLGTTPPTLVVHGKDLQPTLLKSFQHRCNNTLTKRRGASGGSHMLARRDRDTRSIGEAAANRPHSASSTTVRPSIPLLARRPYTADGCLLQNHPTAVDISSSMSNVVRADGSGQVLASRLCSRASEVSTTSWRGGCYGAPSQRGSWHCGERILSVRTPAATSHEAKKIPYKRLSRRRPHMVKQPCMDTELRTTSVLNEFDFLELPSQYSPPLSNPISYLEPREKVELSLSRAATSPPAIKRAQPTTSMCRNRQVAKRSDVDFSSHPMVAHKENVVTPEYDHLMKQIASTNTDDSMLPMERNDSLREHFDIRYRPATDDGVITICGDPTRRNPRDPVELPETNVDRAPQPDNYGAIILPRGSTAVDTMDQAAECAAATSVEALSRPTQLDLHSSTSTSSIDVVDLIDQERSLRQQLQQLLASRDEKIRNLEASIRSLTEELLGLSLPAISNDGDCLALSCNSDRRSSPDAFFLMSDRGGQSPSVAHAPKATHETALHQSRLSEAVLSESAQSSDEIAVILSDGSPSPSLKIDVLPELLNYYEHRGRTAQSAWYSAVEEPSPRSEIDVTEKAATIHMRLPAGGHDDQLFKTWNCSIMNTSKDRNALRDVRQSQEEIQDKHLVLQVSVGSVDSLSYLEEGRYADVERIRAARAGLTLGTIEAAPSVEEKRSTVTTTSVCLPQAMIHNRVVTLSANSCVDQTLMYSYPTSISREKLTNELSLAVASELVETILDTAKVPCHAVSYPVILPRYHSSNASIVRFQVPALLALTPKDMQTFDIVTIENRNHSTAEEPAIVLNEATLSYICRTIDRRCCDAMQHHAVVADACMSADRPQKVMASCMRLPIFEAFPRSLSVWFMQDTLGAAAKEPIFLAGCITTSPNEPSVVATQVDMPNCKQQSRVVHQPMALLDDSASPSHEHLMIPMSDCQAFMAIDLCKDIYRHVDKVDITNCEHMISSKETRVIPLVDPDNYATADVSSVKDGSFGQSALSNDPVAVGPREISLVPNIAKTSSSDELSYGCCVSITPKASPRDSSTTQENVVANNSELAFHTPMAFYTPHRCIMIGDGDPVWQTPKSTERDISPSKHSWYNASGLDTQQSMEMAPVDTSDDSTLELSPPTPKMPRRMAVQDHEDEQNIRGCTGVPRNMLLSRKTSALSLPPRAPLSTLSRYSTVDRQVICGPEAHRFSTSTGSNALEGRKCSGFSASTGSNALEGRSQNTEKSVHHGFQQITESMLIRSIGNRKGLRECRTADQQRSQRRLSEPALPVDLGSSAASSRSSALRPPTKLQSASPAPHSPTSRRSREIRSGSEFSCSRRCASSNRPGGVQAQLLLLPPWLRGYPRHPITAKRHDDVDEAVALFINCTDAHCQFKRIGRGLYSCGDGMLLRVELIGGRLMAAVDVDRVERGPFVASVWPQRFVGKFTSFEEVFKRAELSYRRLEQPDSKEHMLSSTF